MNRLKCLIADPDPESTRQVDVLCRKIGTIELGWKTNSLATGVGIVRKHRPEMAFFCIDASPASAIELISGITKEFPSVQVIALSEKSDAELILQAMRAGASDFLPKPVNEIDLRAVVDKGFKFRVTTSERPERTGKIVSVFSNSGGNGTTTMAVNLADAMARDHGKKTVIVDLVLTHGDVATFLNVTPAYSILDLAKNAEKADYDFLHSLLVRHPSGVYILADPPSIEDGQTISAVQVREVLHVLRSIFDVVVVDTPHQFDERTLTALEMSDTVFLVSLQNLPSLRNTQRCLQLFERIGLRDERLRLVLFRYVVNDEFPKANIEEIMKCAVDFTVPNDYPTVMSSVNRGKSLIETAPDNEITRSFRQLANSVLGAKPARTTGQAAKKRGLLGKLFQPERGSK